MLPANTSFDVQHKVRLLALHDPATIADAAALLSLTEPEASLFIDLHGPKVEAEQRRLELTGDLLEPKARRLALKLLDRIETQADTVDAFDAADLIKHPLRIIENADRVHLAQKDPYANVPMVSVTIIKGHISITPVEESAAGEVVDVAAKPVPDVEGPHGD